MSDCNSVIVGNLPLSITEVSLGKKLDCRLLCLLNLNLSVLSSTFNCLRLMEYFCTV